MRIYPDEYDYLFERKPEDYCELWRLTIDRQIDDLENGYKRGLVWDEEEAEWAAEFFPEFLRHSKGEWKGKPFELDHYQLEHIIKPLFGWKKPNFDWDSSKDFDWDANPYDPDRWVRRFNRSYLQLPKKTGKSTLAAGIGIFLMVEGEAVPEIYSAGATRDQAKLIHEEAKRMIKQSPDLRNRLKEFKNTITYEEESGKWGCFSKQAMGADGINNHGALVDELHQWPWSAKEVLSILTESSISRRNPLMVITTTAGETKECLCYQERLTGEKILRGLIEDDSTHILICEPTPEELEEHGWDSPELAYMVNPAWGANLETYKIKAQIKAARQVPTKLTDYKRYRLNLWVGEQKDKMFDIDKFRDLPAHVWIPGLRNKEAFVGVDMSEGNDITALVAVVPDVGKDLFYSQEWYWVPEDNVKKRVDEHNVPYDLWIEQGHLLTTPGNWIHHSVIREQIMELAEFFDLQIVGIDAWNMGLLGPELQDEYGMDVAKVRQGTGSLNDPCKLMQRLILAKHWLHSKNPVTEWMVSNCIAYKDSSGNIKPNKEKSEEKIDFVSAAATACYCILERLGDSIYITSPLETVER